MSKRKTHHLPARGKHTLKGFSLLEFLVAGILSMIVLVAVSKGYFTARQLNNSASDRLNSQQDLRNAANMMVRDARMAGSFGCFSFSSITHKDTSANGKTADKAIQGDRTIADGNSATSNQKAFRLLEGGADNLMPVRELESGAGKDFNPAGFTATSGKALVFVYGADDAQSGDPLVLSSCDTLVRPANDTWPADKTVLNVSSKRAGEAAVLRYTVAAYAVGSIGGQQGLYRFRLVGNNWGNPQLLAKGVTGADFGYVYANNCPDGAGNSETFEYSGSLNRIPALVRIKLAGGAKDPNQIYNIDASVRGGNLCANRSLSS